MKVKSSPPQNTTESDKIPKKKHTSDMAIRLKWLCNIFEFIKRISLFEIQSKH